MAVIVEISENGTLQIPEDILRALQPNTHFRVEVGDKNRLILSPVSSGQPFWVTATPQERAERWHQWVQSHPDGPNLPDEALRRESMYD